MNKTREIIVTQTFNEMGVQIDLKTTPLVRCKDCKWYDSERHDCPYMEEVLDDDYCSYGELKEQEDGKDTDSDSDM